MAKVYDALKRIEKERQQRMRVAPRPIRIDQPFWRRWLARQAEGSQVPTVLLDPQSHAVERLAARLDALEDHIAKNIPTASDVMLLERLDALARQLEGFEEHVTHSHASAQQLLPPLQTRLEKFEGDIATKLAGLTTRLDERMERLQFRITVLCLVLAFLAVVSLLRR